MKNMLNNPLKSKAHRAFGRLNLVPYTDINLVLLVILMVFTLLLINQNITQNVQKKSIPTFSHENAALIISINKKGQYLLDAQRNSQQSVTLKHLKSILKLRLKEQPKLSILLQSEPNTQYYQLSEFIIFLKTLGIDQIGLITQNLQPKENNDASDKTVSQ